MKKYCRVCGREENRLSKDFLCEKHQQQIKEYGYTLDENPRSENDLNEIRIEGNRTFITLYDKFQEKLEEEVIIDTEDYETIKHIRWNKSFDCIRGIYNKQVVMLDNFIMYTNNHIKHIDGNIYNCRKKNLKEIVPIAKIKKVDKRKKGKITITSLGNSTIGITGSCHSVEYDKSDGTRGLILIEVGMAQGGTILEDYNANKMLCDYVPFDRCEAILISHNHIDHMGNIPAGIQRGFNGKLIMTETQKALAYPLLLDSVFVHQRNVKELNKKGNKYQPLYTEADTYLTMNRVETVPTNEITKINEEISVRYINNSHCIGAKQIELFIKKPSGHISKILYTGDLGSRENYEYSPFTDKTEYTTKADVMICEATYGSSTRGFTKKEAKDEREDFVKTIKEAVDNKRDIIIPAFSFSRSQLLMCMLYEALKECSKPFEVVVDSKLTNSINGVYSEILQGDDREFWQKVMSWNRFKFTKEFKDTEMLATKQDNIPRIVISSSGFSENGHIRYWLQQKISNPNTTVIFTGFTGKGTLSDRLLNQKSPTFNIDGVICNRKCKFKCYKTFSSHIQQAELIDYFKQINVGKIILHHGDADAKDELSKKAIKELRKIGKTTKIIPCSKGIDTFII